MSLGLVPLHEMHSARQEVWTISRDLIGNQSKTRSCIEQVNHLSIVSRDLRRLSVMAKFSQNAVLEKLLLSTGDAYLVEHTANDRYWGDGGDGSGKNKLGYTLMAIRNELGTSSQQLQIEGCDLRHELTSTPSYRPPPPSSLQMSQTSASSVTTSSATSSPTSFLTSSPMTSSPTRDTKPVTSGLVNQRRSAFESTPSQSESRHKKR
eukprot:TRINITY_DN1476_c0_g1_i3.p2 TRINITY_DN1476_c0_g1~~TRINITY_DN1476_c0_g1_i3.p2  ORF type:complete len:207 (-),score=15.43 TRINITY_DN1476_c0_g1_i3:53-673(-)